MNTNIAADRTIDYNRFNRGILLTVLMKKSVAVHPWSPNMPAVHPYANDISKFRLKPLTITNLSWVKSVLVRHK